MIYFCIVFPNSLILLRELVGVQKGKDYKRLLNTVIVLEIHLNIRISANWVQDNCSIHISGHVRQCYETNDINIIDWSSMSADIHI